MVLAVICLWIGFALGLICAALLRGGTQEMGRSAARLQMIGATANRSKRSSRSNRWRSASRP